MTNFPKYLRVALTDKCPMRCPFCHNEGAGEIQKESALQIQYWDHHISEMVDAGVRKVKFVGGEPLLYKDLPLLVSRLRMKYPDIDVSLITAGSLPLHRLQRCFEMGLTRANMSIHGWQKEFFFRNSKSEQHWLNRQKTLDYLLSQNRPLKLNYVYSSSTVESDLLLFLKAMSEYKVVINVLDDLKNTDITPAFLIQRLSVLLGQPTVRRDVDSHSLNTLHLGWGGPMRVEIKDQHLGTLAPWKSCQDCPVKKQCTEGIHAIRMYADGRIGLCMDRDDLKESMNSQQFRLSGPQFVRDHLVKELV